MKDYYWYKGNPVFDWNKNEELDDMESDFGKPGNVFLEVHDDDKIVGVFGFRHRGKQATLRRWEPATLKPTTDLRLHKALLTYALDYLEKKGVERVGVLVKHPAENAKVANHLIELFHHYGMDRYRPDSVDLVTKLDDIPEPPDDDGPAL